MIVECPACNTIFPVDPKKVPTGGVDARCSVCSEVFFVAPPGPEAEVFEPVVERIETEAEIVEPYTAEPASEAPIEDPVEAVPDGIVEADMAATDDDEGVVETEAEPAFEEEEMPSAVEAEFDAGPESVVEVEPETNVEAAFEEVEDSVVESAERLQEEAAEKAEEFSTVMEAETVEVVEEVAETVAEIPEGPTISAPAFGKRDPMEKAQRLARVLVSDIILYNPDRHHAATETGRVREEFEEEIQKSWSEYVEQVGDEVANTTPYFNNALNEILAKGEKIF